MVIPEKLTDARVWLLAMGQAMVSPGYRNPADAADAALSEFKMRFPAAESGAEHVEPHMRADQQAERHLRRT